MNQSEREIIRDKLPELLTEIKCESEFLALLLKHEAITEAEKQNSEAQRCFLGPSGQVSKLMDLLVTRINGFHALKIALDKTNQTGALKLLNESSSRKLSRSYSESSSKSRSVSTSSFSGSLVVGKDCKFSDIRNIVEDCPGHAIFLTDNWRKLAAKLDIGDKIDMARCQRNILYDNKQHIDILDDMLHAWYNYKSNEATLHVLCDVIEKCGSKAIADALKQNYPES